VPLLATATITTKAKSALPTD
jgi:hypothetical protein